MGFAPPGQHHDHPSPERAQRRVWFHRTELSAILDVYGRMVAHGEWRDYAINSMRDAAVFCVFRKATETPLYTIEKHPDLARKQGAYAVRGPSGQVLKRGHDLRAVLRVFDKRRFSVVNV